MLASPSARCHMSHDLSSTPGTHMRTHTVGELILDKLSSALHIHAVVHVCAYVKYLQLDLQSEKFKINTGRKRWKQIRNQAPCFLIEWHFVS